MACMFDMYAICSLVRQDVCHDQGKNEQRRQLLQYSNKYNIYTAIYAASRWWCSKIIEPLWLYVFTYIDMYICIYMLCLSSTKKVPFLFRCGSCLLLSNNTECERNDMNSLWCDSNWRLIIMMMMMLVRCLLVRFDNDWDDI